MQGQFKKQEYADSISDWRIAQFAYTDIKLKVFEVVF